MVQLELDFGISKEMESDYTYTVGIINDYESVWFVKNNIENRNKTIMEWLLMYPNTRPVQSNYKHYKYQLIANQKNKA